MMSRLLVLLAMLAVSIQAFVPLAFSPRNAAFMPSTTVSPSTSLMQLFASRINAKKEKIKRNRENMRKFKTTGRKGTSRRKTLKKAQSSRARQEEAEFIAKCFITTGPADADEEDKKK